MIRIFFAIKLCGILSKLRIFLHWISGKYLVWKEFIIIDRQGDIFYIATANNRLRFSNAEVHKIMQLQYYN